MLQWWPVLLLDPRGRHSSAQTPQAAAANSRDSSPSEILFLSFEGILGGILSCDLMAGLQIEQLPEEILLVIFEQLAIKDRCQLRLTCKKFDRVVFPISMDEVSALYAVWKWTTILET